MTKRELQIKPEQGRTADGANPDEVMTLYNNIIVAQRDIEKWIAKEFAGIDLNNRSKENLERIAQKRLILKDKWNEWDGNKFVNRPKSMQYLGKTVRGKHTFGTRFNQLLMGTMTLGTQRIDTSEKKLGGISDPYAMIDKLVGFQTKIEDVQRVRLGKDLKRDALSDLGITLYQPFNKESNVYYNADLDRSNTTNDLAAARKARIDYKTKNPSLYSANPGGYLEGLNENNQFYKPPTLESGTPSPYNYRNRRKNDPYDVDIQQADGSYKRATSIQRNLLKAGFKSDELTQLMIDHKNWKKNRGR